MNKMFEYPISFFTVFVGFLAATRQRHTTNVDLSINHIVQDSEVFLQHVIILTLHGTVLIGFKSEQSHSRL